MGKEADVITVLIVSRVRLYREGVRHLLEGKPGIHVIGGASTWERALPLGGAAPPDVLLLDVPISEGACAIRALAPAYAVALGVAEHEAEVVAWAEAGAAGYVPPDGSLSRLIATIEAVANGETLCSPRIVAALVRRLAAVASDGSGTRTPAEALTPREREIVLLLDEGLSNKEIASRLYIEVTTVKNHVHNILEKLHVHRRGQAAARLRRGEGLELLAEQLRDQRVQAGQRGQLGVR
jgi:DNA-binding NarL/FixJ family response regulator